MNRILCRHILVSSLHLVYFHSGIHEASLNENMKIWEYLDSLQDSAEAFGYDGAIRILYRLCEVVKVHKIFTFLSELLVQLLVRLEIISSVLLSQLLFCFLCRHRGLKLFA